SPMTRHASTPLDSWNCRGLIPSIMRASLLHSRLRRRPSTGGIPSHLSLPPFDTWGYIYLMTARREGRQRRTEGSVLVCALSEAQRLFRLGDTRLSRRASSVHAVSTLFVVVHGRRERGGDRQPRGPPASSSRALVMRTTTRPLWRALRFVALPPGSLQ